MATSDEIIERHPEYKKRLPQWTKIRDAIEGEDAVKKKGSDYLPIPSGQASNSPAYKAYLERASFYAISDRTLMGLLGLIFRIDTTWDLPTSMEYLEAAATPGGDPLGRLVRDVMLETLAMGRIGMLVDLPTIETVTPQPYISVYRAEDIWHWNSVFENGQDALRRVVLCEKPDSNKEPIVLRELLLEENAYRQVIWREKAGSDGKEQDFEVIDEIVPSQNGAPLPMIPFEFVPMPKAEKPPMLDLVNVNIAHYRNSADYEQSLYLTGQPTPYMFGIAEEDKPKAIGSGTIWTSTNPDTKAGMIEFSGSGIASLKEAMLDKEARMAVLGARIIRDDAERSNITAETTRLNARADTSVLLEATDVVEMAFDHMLGEFVAPWAGAGGSTPEVRVNRDHIETRLDPQSILALVQSWQGGAFSYDTLFENLQRGEVIPAESSVEEEIEKIVSGGPPLPTLEPEPTDDSAA